MLLSNCCCCVAVSMARRSNFCGIWWEPWKRRAVAVWLVGSSRNRWWIRPSVSSSCRASSPPECRRQPSTISAVMERPVPPPAHRPRASTAKVIQDDVQGPTLVFQEANNKKGKRQSMKVCDDGAQPDVSFISAHQIRALELMDRPGFCGRRVEHDAEFRSASKDGRSRRRRKIVEMMSGDGGFCLPMTRLPLIYCHFFWFWWTLVACASVNRRRRSGAENVAFGARQDDGGQRRSACQLADHLDSADTRSVRSFGPRPQSQGKREIRSSAWSESLNRVVPGGNQSRSVRSGHYSGHYARSASHSERCHFRRTSQSVAGCALRDHQEGEDGSSRHHFHEGAAG